MAGIPAAKPALSEGGPAGVITTMGVFRFDDKTKEMYLEKCHPGITPEKVRENVSWDLKISPTVSSTQPPTREQVEIMHILDPYGLYLGIGRQGMGDPEKGFDFSIWKCWTKVTTSCPNSFDAKAFR